MTVIAVHGSNWDIFKVITVLLFLRAMIVRNVGIRE